MTTTLSRGQRLPAPKQLTGHLQLPPPPELTPAEGSSGLLMNLLPMLGSLGSIVFVAASTPGVKGMLAAGMFLAASLGFVGVNGWRQRQQHTTEVLHKRREYLALLAEVRDRARLAARQQRANLYWNYPDPQALPGLAEDRARLWERSAVDGDFLQVRFGKSSQPLSLELVPPETPPMAQLDPVAASAMHRLLNTHRVQQNLPATVRLSGFSRIEITGNEATVRSLARAIVCSAAAGHSPDELQIAVVAGPSAIGEWDWAKWLPHNHSRRERDGVGPARMIVESVADLDALLPAELTERDRFTQHAAPTLPHVLIVVDGQPIPLDHPIITTDGVLGVTVLELPEEWEQLTVPSRARLALGSAFTRGPQAGQVPLEVVLPNARGFQGLADQLSCQTAEAFARRLTPLYTASGPRRRDALTTSTGLVDLLGLGDVRDFDVQAGWRPRLQRDRLRVPIGVDGAGAPVALDIKEIAQQGMGPHGLVVGATGSGKSELLRTLVLALAMTHSSETLNFVLADFKGGASFAGMADLPHVSAIITNLQNELTLVDRMQDALNGEMVRRQELLRAAGNFAKVSDYERARVSGGRDDLAPLPALLIVCDEFSELLSSRPEFIDLFVSIGRLGRSLSMHLLLASQRLEEGRLRGLESHLSYRIGLKTNSAEESRIVLGRPDAYELPGVPGLGFLKTDANTAVKFKAAYVSDPPPARSRANPTPSATIDGILPFTAAPVLSRARLEPSVASPVEQPADPADRRPVFEIAIARMRDQGPAAHKVWLPPLNEPSSLDELFGDLAVNADAGLRSARWRQDGAGLAVPLGIVDRPAEQRRDTLLVDLAGAAGHVAIIGAPRTGKSTLARSLLAALSLTMTPLEAQFYVLDFGGGTFSPFTKLAHVAGVGTRGEPDVVRRIVAELKSIINAREQFFRAHGIESIETYRQRRRQGLVDDGYGDLFLVVDGWSTVRTEFETLEPEISDLAGRGLTFGLHLITAATRWMDFRSQLKDLFGTRLELRLGDPTDSEVDRRVAASVPVERPGRGITAGRHHFLAALPRIDGSRDPDTLGEGVDHLIDEVNAGWQGPTGPKLRLLPERIDLDEIRAQAPDARGVLLGIDEAALAPVELDVASQPHLYLFGDVSSGKSAMLRGYAREVMRRYSPSEAQLLVLDYRRQLLGEVGEDYLAGYLATHNQASTELAGLTEILQRRLPGPEVTAEQLRHRTWWSGAEVFVLVDDYDLVATSAGNPLTPLVPLLAQAGDIGLHLVLTRRSGGASRVLYDPVIQALRDLGSPGLLLSGSPEEGPLIGSVRPVVAPPGRGRLVTRGHGLQVVQLAWTEPSAL